MSQVLLGFRGYPMLPHVIKLIILDEASSIQYGYRKKVELMHECSPEHLRTGIRQRNHGRR